MAIIEDHFTGESVITDLDLHTPDTTGTGYTTVEQTSIRDLRVDPGTDRLDGEDDISDRTLYSAQGTYPSNQYNIEMLVVTDAGSDDPIWLLGRLTDASNYYAAGLYDTTGVDCYLLKKVTDVVTTLDSADTDWTPPATIKLEVRDTAKKVFIDGVEKLSDPDNALTSIGEAGIATGNIRVETDDNSPTWQLDDFLVTDAGGAAAESLIVGTVFSSFPTRVGS